ncbi:MAG: ABC transporter permease [Myxococcota bacterium]
MRTGLAGLRMLALVSLRSLWTHKGKTLTVGSLLFFGTFLVVLGTALLDSIERSMQQSIVASLAGHIQVWDEEARDDLALFGSGFMGADDIGDIPRFGPVEDALEGLPDVKAVVPMGLGMATLSTPVEMDQVIQQLRDAVGAGDDALVDDLADRLRGIAAELRGEYEKRRELTTDTEETREALEALDRVQSDAFWAEMEREPEMTLQYLDTRIAPLSSESRLVYLRYLGTDIPAFTKHFDRFQMVRGEPVPPGRRGILLSERFWEERLKHKIARDLDRIGDKRAQGATIAEDADLRYRASKLPGQYQRITFQLEPKDAEGLAADLRELLPDVEGDVADLVQAFLRIDDANFDERYRQFYEVVAPRIQLYPFEVGDVLTLRALTRGGYLTSVNVKLWGIFRFSGLEESDMAGAQNLIDLATFRQLYGKMTPEKLAELARIRESVGVEAVDREQAEDALFGGDDLVEEESDGQGSDFDEFAEVDLRGQVERKREASAATFDQETVRDGLALNAAVILEDPETLDTTLTRIRDVSDSEDLGIQATDWQTASGLVGQFITVVRLVLYVAIFIILVVALVIINNSMIIATMERVAEIGTMRAIGAPRSFVLLMFLLETSLLALVAGGAGGLAGAGVVAFLGEAGISAQGVDVLVFLFSGPALHPTVGLEQLAVGLVVILVASVASTLYPAVLATRIQPVVAMQSEGA